jgi:hypothetical protein
VKVAIPIEVSSYAGYKEEEIPRFIKFGEEVIEVKEIKDRWYEEDKNSYLRKRFFKIKGTDQMIYTIFYNENNDTWYLVYHE